MITALAAAQLCARAYNEPATIEAGNAHVLLVVIDGIVYAIFRGSATRLDWYYDFGAIPSPGIYGSVDLGLVHPMFFADACSVFALIMQAAAGRPLWPLGHSKGGGDAEQLALLVASLYPAQFAGYTTFGKPKTMAVGNQRGAPLLYGKPDADYRHNRDPVPLVPDGFSHIRPTTVFGRRPFLTDLNLIGDHLLGSTIAALKAPALKAPGAS